MVHEETPCSTGRGSTGNRLRYTCHLGAAQPSENSENTSWGMVGALSVFPPIKAGDDTMFLDKDEFRH